MKPAVTITIVAAASLLAAACGANDAAAPAPPPSQQAATAPAPAVSARFQQTLTLQGVTFTVTCDNDSSINQLSIVPAGLEIDNTAITQDVDGQVVGAEVADLDANGSPELYVYVRPRARRATWGTTSSRSSRTDSCSGSRSIVTATRTPTRPAARGRSSTS